MDQFHQPDPAHLSSVYIGKEVVSGWSSSRLAAGPEWEWEEEGLGNRQGLFPECLVLGFLGMVLADISVKRIKPECGQEQEVSPQLGLCFCASSV